MQKRFGLLAGLTIMALLAFGCGRNNEESEEDTSQDDAVVIEEDEEEENNDNLVPMEKTTEDDKSSITNIMGDKTAGADVVIENDTGLDISEFYCRPSGEEEDWGSDYIKGAFTLKNGDKALLYYDPNAKSEDGKAITSYDLRVNFTKEDESTCMFRNLPLSDIEEMQLKMEDGVPFVTYISLSTKRSVSTLEDAKARMGLTDEDEDEDDTSDTSNDDDQDVEETDDSDELIADDIDSDSDVEAEASDDETEEAAADSGEAVNSGETEEASNSSYDSGYDSGGYYSGDSDTYYADSSGNYDSSGGSSSADDYVGDSMNSWEGQYGSASSSEYDIDPDTGATVGYYYYDGYTVETIEENGEEVVTGVW